MRDVDDPALLDYLRAENAAAERFFAPHLDTIETIFGEIRSRVQETDMSTPVEFGPWWYVTSTTEGMNYPAHHRGPTAERATEIVLLDENVEADGHEFFELGAFDVSMDHRVVAWSMDVTGDEHYTLALPRPRPPASTSTTGSTTPRTQASPGRATASGCST